MASKELFDEIVKETVEQADGLIEGEIALVQEGEITRYLFLPDDLELTDLATQVHYYTMMLERRKQHIGRITLLFPLSYQDTFKQQPDGFLRLCELACAYAEGYSALKLYIRFVGTGQVYQNPWGKSLRAYLETLGLHVA